MDASGLTTRMRTRRFSRRAVCAVSWGISAALISAIEPVSAVTLNNWVDPNANGAAAANARSDCTSSGFTQTIKYTLSNENMENLYTIDWRAVNFRVTNVPSNGSRSATLPGSWYSCPVNQGPVDWIDQGAVAPDRGTQTFPTSYHYYGWVTLDLVTDLLSLASYDGDGDSDQVTLASVFSDEYGPLFTFTSTASPQDVGNPEGAWDYSYAIHNHTASSAYVEGDAISGLSSYLMPGYDSENSFTAGRPMSFGPGHINVNGTAQFPAAMLSPSAIPEPSAGLLLASGLAVLTFSRRKDKRRSRA
ncbi:PEP-CTERM sorting domain-containing protein [Myxococcota bacterium]|nr:PEP-CTERM sorting domain-containing protein [Myxococcota bacterium]